MQLAGSSQNAFTFRLLTFAQDALLQYPHPEVRSLHDLEKVLQVRVVAGGPPLSGPEDPDGMGFVMWQPVIYCTHWVDAFSFIDFLLKYKAQRGYLENTPELTAHIVGANLADDCQLPAPWRLLRDPASFKLPGPFSVLPPKGRRHVLAQLEKHAAWEDILNEPEIGADPEKGSGASATYILTFFGGIYPFKDSFEKQGLKSMMVAHDENPSGKKEFVRYLTFKMGSEEAMQQVVAVLVDALKEVPVCFTNMAEESDVAAAWLQRQPSIFRVEDA